MFTYMYIMRHEIHVRIHTQKKKYTCIKKTKEKGGTKTVVMQ